LRGPPPDRAWWVPDPSRSRRLVGASSPRLVLRLRSPRHRRWVVRADGSASCLHPQGVPRLLVCRTLYLGSVLHARMRVHQSLAHARCPIVCTSLSHRPSAAPPALQAAVLPEQPQPPASSAQQPQPRRLPVPSPPVLAVPGGASLWPAGGRQGRLAAGVGCLRHALARHAPGGQRGGRAGRPQARAPAGAGWQGVGGRGRVGLREKWLYFSYTQVQVYTFGANGQ
jgi:hypothetical protein